MDPAKGKGAGMKLHALLAAFLLLLTVALAVLHAASGRALRARQDAIQSDVQKTQIQLDRHLSLAFQIRDSLIMDSDILSLYAPNNYDAVKTLSKKLHLFTANQSFYDEVLLFGANNEYLFSSKSSYLFSTFLDINPLPGFAGAEAFRTYLQALQGPDMLRYRRGGGVQYLFSIPYTRDAVAHCVLFILPETALQDALGGMISPEDGHAAVFMPGGDVFARMPQADIMGAAGLYETILYAQTPYVTHAQRVQVDGRQAYLVWRRSESTDYTYASLWTSPALAALFTAERALDIGMYAAGILAAAVWALYLYRVLLRPILRIQQRAQGGGLYHGLEGVGNYLDVLEAKYSQVTGHIIFNILRGIVDEKELPPLLEKLGLYDRHSQFAVMLAAFREETAIQDVYQLLESIMPAHYRCLAHRMERDNAHAVLVNVPAGTPGEEIYDTLALLPQMDGRIASVRAGHVGQGLMDAPQSLVEAMTAGVSATDHAGIQVFSPEGIQRFPQARDALAGARRMLAQEDFAGAADAVQALGEAIVRADVPLLILRYICCTTLLSIPRGDRKGMLTDDMDVYFLLHYEEPAQYLAFLGSLAEGCRRVAHGTEPEEPLSLLEQMIQYMNSHARDPGFSFQHMAEAYQLSLPALSRYFHDQAGTTINDYMTGIKMNRAMHLLSDTDLSIQDISLEVGYYNPTSFSRRFKQIVGVSPIEYRKGGVAEREG